MTMAIKIGKTVYRNIQEQVEKNKEDIEGIKKTIPYPSDEYYNKDESDAKFETIADIESNYYDKDEIDTALANKQDSLNEGDGIDINSENNISVDTAYLDDRYLLKTNFTQRYLHRLFFDIDNESSYVTLNLITTSSVAWTLGNLPTISNAPIDITAASFSLTGSYEFTLNVRNNDIQIINQNETYLIDFEGVTSVHDRVQPL